MGRNSPFRETSKQVFIIKVTFKSKPEIREFCDNFSVGTHPIREFSDLLIVNSYEESSTRYTK